MNKEGGGFPPERVKGNVNNVSGVFKSDQTKPLRYSHHEESFRSPQPKQSQI